MFALLSLLIVVALVSSAVRRVGLAGCVALFAGFITAFDSGQPSAGDWWAAGLVTLLVFVAVRLAQSWGRSHTPVRVAVARERLAGRAVDRRAEAWSRVPTAYEAGAYESDPEWLGEELDGARGRPECERRG